MPARAPGYLTAARAFAIAAVMASSLASSAVGHGGGGHRGGGGSLADIPPPPGVAPAGPAAAGSDSSAILNLESEQIEARDRTTDLAIWLMIMVAAQTVIFGVALSVALRAARGAGDAARVAAMLERAYVFLEQDLSLTHGDHRGPHGGLKVSFQFGLKNHGKTPAIIEWINIRHQYLPQPPEGAYDETGMGEGRVLGAGASLRFDHHDVIVPGVDWDKAEAGEGAVYLHGRVVYRDILKNQHETYFCWRYDHAHGAFQVAASADLNRFD